MNGLTLTFLADLVQMLAVGALGLFAGAMLTEAGVLVPYWRSLDASAFHAWYRANAGRLIGFFGPLTWGAGLTALLSAAVSLVAPHDGWRWAVAAAALMLMIVGMLPLYFKRANQTFAAGLPSADETAHAIDRWAAWHRVRTALSVLALATSILAM